MGGGAWLKNVPPGLELKDISTQHIRGIQFYRATDQYGRSWEYIEHRDGTTEIRYTDESGLFHEVMSYNGQWHDTYTDPNIGRLVETNTGVDGPPPQLPPWLERRDQHTWTDESGNVHHVATDQYGRQWDWYRDQNGTKHAGYADENGQWHQVREINGRWYDRSWDENGEETLTNLGYNHPAPRDPNEVAGLAFLNDPDMTAEGEPAPGEAGTTFPPGYETDDIVVVEPDDPRLGTSPRYMSREEWESKDPNSPAPTTDPIPSPGPSLFGAAPAATPPSGDAGGGPQEAPPAPEPQPTGQPEDLPADAPGGEAGVPQPVDDGGGSIPGVGVPYEDYIPFYPMEQDPATGEWRNAEPEEIPGVGEAAAAPPPAGGSEASGWPEMDPQGDEYAIPQIEPADPYLQPPPPVDESLTTEAGWPSFDPSQQQEEAGWAEPGAATEEPAGYEAYHQGGFEDPALTDPALAEPGVADEGFDDALGA